MEMCEPLVHTFLAFVNYEPQRKSKYLFELLYEICGNFRGAFAEAQSQLRSTITKTLILLILLWLMYEEKPKVLLLNVLS